MADSNSALIFPYTNLSSDQVDRLGGVFKPLFLYQPAGMEPSSGPVGLAESGLVELIRPAKEPADDLRLKEVLADLRRWAGEFRDLKELAHLRSLSQAESSEASPLSLASAIRSYGQGGDRPDLVPHLVLHLSAWLDKEQADIRSASAGLKEQEESLEQALGEGGPKRSSKDRTGFPAGPDPLRNPEPDQDQFLRLRLKAWAELYRAWPVEVDLMITRPEVVALVAADYQEKTGRDPREEAGWDDYSLLKEGFKAWRFSGVDLLDLAGLDEPGQADHDRNDQILIAQMELEV